MDNTIDFSRFKVSKEVQEIMDRFFQEFGDCIKGKETPEGTTQVEALMAWTFMQTAIHEHRLDELTNTVNVLSEEFNARGNNE